jgi:putative ABC transport system permease protein
MIRNYLKIAWRNLMKNKVFSFINVFGLSAGLACCMMISLYIIHESQYDRYQKNGNNIYQIGTFFLKVGQDLRSAPNTPAPMAQMMKQEFPEIGQTTRLLRLFSEDKTLIQYSPTNEATKSFYEEKGFLADSTFFRVFTYNFVEGSPFSTLSEPNTLVLSQEIAKKIFGDQPALNKIVHVSSSTNGDHDFRITGVFKPFSAPSHIDARFIMSMQGGDIEDYIKRRGTDLASNNMFYTYLALRPGSDAQKLEKKFPAFMQKYAGKDLKEMGMDKRQFLVALKDIHLRSGMADNVTPPGSVMYLYILGSVALFILLIACVNFMNLSTARSSKRSAEVGVRKVLGAERGSLIGQFLGESLLMSFIAFILGLSLTVLLLPAFNHVSGKIITFSLIGNAREIGAFFILSVITGLIAGSYPAFYLSSFKPVKVLKGKISNSFAAVSLRKGLVVFQFIISIVLIVASVVIGKQMSYMQSSDLGFQKDRQIIIPLRSEPAKKIYASLQSELGNNPHISSVGASYYYPGISNPSDMGLYKKGQTMQDARRTKMNYVDAGFMQTLGITPVAGRLFLKDNPADTSSRVILNEEAVHQMGFKNVAEAIGQKVYVDFHGQSYAMEILGVVKDFHFENFHIPISPYGLQLSTENSFNYVIAHVKEGSLSTTIASVEKIWHTLNPNEPFEYSFLDQDFQKNYDAEIRLRSTVSYFTIIAILISCLGLFGLATFSAEQRTKEIGVRKVLGAGVGNIIGLLSKEFLKLVAVAIVIASPLAWWAMNKWLQDFAYRTSIGWTVFAVTAAIALCIALFTISFQAIKAALANPVKSLRTE